jgi:hypothetical protein
LEYNGKFYPVIPVVLFTKESTQFEAYVDSGASLSIFSYLKRLEIDLEKGNLAY